MKSGDIVSNSTPTPKWTANYIHGQASEETVQHLEKVKTEYVMGDPYEIWDVTTDRIVGG
jgi:hypothetical protein